MADSTGNIVSKNYYEKVPQAHKTFYVKGADDYDYGMKRRLSRIFQPDGRTVMLAFDHGYILGSTHGLERLDIAIPPLMPHVDCLMGTRGAFRAALPAGCDKAIALRASAGSSVSRDDMSIEYRGVSMEDAVRLDASCVAVQSFIGTENEAMTIRNINETVDEGYRYGMPVLGVVAVGKQMERTSKFFFLATRMLAEFGCQMVKSYYCEDFEKVTAACPVPLVMAGGKKLPEDEALEMVYRAISEGAAGVDMGRNVFQAANPVAMVQAVNGVVHGGLNGKQAFELYQDLVK